MRSETAGMNRLTEASFRELAGLARLFNIHGLKPIVIGGWAVYYYTGGPGSVDIDLVLPSKSAIRIFERFCGQHGFKKDKRAKMRVLFKKEIETKPNQREEMELDIFALPDRNLLAADKSIEIPWRLAEKYSEDWEIGENAIARVPKKEVLLLYKTAALIDRQFKIRTWAGLPKFTRDRLTAKIEKDKQDIQGLLKTEIDKNRLEQLLEETGFKTLYRNALKGQD